MHCPPYAHNKIIVMVIGRTAEERAKPLLLASNANVDPRTIKAMRKGQVLTRLDERDRSLEPSTTTLDERGRAREKRGVERFGGRSVGCSGVSFQVLSAILQQETIAVGREMRELARLRKAYGRGKWRKRKGIARIRLADGTVCTAEIHWYEAHGIGRKELKIKRIVA